LESTCWTFPINAYRKIYSKTLDHLIEILIRINKENLNLNSTLLEHEDDEQKGNSNDSNSITNHFHGEIKGSAMVFGKNISQKENQINYNDKVDELIERIRELGFDTHDTDELKKIIVEQERSDVPIGRQILRWIGKMTTKAIEKGIEHKIPELTDMVSGYLN